MPTLENFEKEDEITDFVRCKIESILAQDTASIVHPDTSTSSVDGAGPSSSVPTTFTPGVHAKQIDVVDSNHFKAAVHKFQNVFSMPVQEKLVNCKSFRLLTVYLIISRILKQTIPAVSGRTTCLVRDGFT